MRARVRAEWLLCACALVLAMSACGGDDDEDNRPRAAPPAARRDSVERKPVYAEAEAAQILRVINGGEVATAQVAQERTQNDDIRRFANVMIADHRAMTALLDSLVPPIPDTINPESRRLRAASAQLVDSLWRIEGGFNNTYIENQVREHERALLLMDTALIPSARNPELKKLLRDMRPAVVAHLQRAKQIYAARMANPATATPTRTSSRPTAPRPTPTPEPRPVVPQPQPVPRETVFPLPQLPPPTSTSNM